MPARWSVVLECMRGNMAALIVGEAPLCSHGGGSIDMYDPVDVHASQHHDCVLAATTFPLDLNFQRRKLKTSLG